ncbi:MAG: demethoxyubiquinone hydroxylase family protein [Rhodospirillales bacterium]|nr:demethoxyubiquinone hydroxylase family protein [Rhodospirillales bacterium]MDP6804295.1 demethoxyubiquinone hydroxylase family protein [Rhodospirillales bacterium]
MAEKPKPRQRKSRPRKSRPRLPGDPSAEELIARIIRVDHAGEYGAVRIYAGQLRVLGETPSARPVREMAEAEAQHLETFERLVVERRVRPTALMPIWTLAGFALGAATAALGPRATMACAVAVEEVIDEHYTRQIERLGDDEPALARTLRKFRADEREHRDAGLAHGAEEAPGYLPMTTAIKAASRLAIWLSERI